MDDKGKVLKVLFDLELFAHDDTHSENPILIECRLLDKFGNKIKSSSSTNKDKEGCFYLSLPLVPNRPIVKTKNIDFTIPINSLLMNSDDLNLTCELVVVSHRGDVLCGMLHPFTLKTLPVPVKVVASVKKELTSSIINCNIRFENNAVTFAYELAIKTEDNLGCIVYLELLDSRGELLRDLSPVTKDLKAFKGLTDHESHSFGKLAFRRDIPLASGSDARFFGELKIPRERFSLRVRGKPVFVNIFLLNSAQEELDYREFEVRLKFPKLSSSRFLQRIFRTA